MRPLEGLFAGRYTMRRVIGQGATATVHLARDERSGVDVAIKLLREELAQSAASARFLKEIERTAALQHVRILPVLDSGDHEGRPFYVLPYMEGGTLRMRLKRESQLQIPDAIAIAKEVAEALDHAHARGLIHRDIKPENILFNGGAAHVADFGIARALQSVYGDTSTSSATIRGTPAYMSPEQAAGGEGLDHRSDVYSLACVVYEMITGMQAFIGPTAESVMAQRFQHTPREIRVYRATAPSALDPVLTKAFAISRADRYASCGDFVAALEAAAASTAGPVARTVVPLWRRPGPISVAVAGAAVLVIATTSSESVRSWLRLTAIADAAPLDTTRYAVLSTAMSAADSITPAATELVRESLTRWKDLSVVDAFHVKDVLARTPAGSLTMAEAQRAATDLGAGRYVRIQVTPSPDSLTIRAVVFDTRGNTRLHEKSLRVSNDLSKADSAVGLLTAELLFPIGLGRPNADLRGTNSFGARSVFLRGQSALEQWNLPQADSEFLRATEIDPEFAQAYLWLAQVRAWRKQAPASWTFAAERAAAAAGQLAARDSALAYALAKLARGDFVGACATWSNLTSQNAFDFASWYGLGTCLVGDGTVIKDPRSPSGWAFRTSYARALDAYERAFRLLPSMHKSFRGASFVDIQRLFMTSGSPLRNGRAEPPDTMRFSAHPTWQGDSLAFIPLPTNDFLAAQSVTRSPAANEAVLHQRRRFRQIAAMWRAAYPESVDALEAVAAALELLGDNSALDTLRRARTLAKEGASRLRIGVAEVWLQVKLSAPGSLSGLRVARALADSLLNSKVDLGPREAELLGGLSALTGRAIAAARYAIIAERGDTPAPIAESAPALVSYAAMGGPPDSVHALERKVERAIERDLIASERDLARSQWLVRAASLAILEHPFESVGALPPTGSYRVKLLKAVGVQSLSQAQAVLADLRKERQRGGLRASDIAADGLYAEAAVLARLGDDRGVAAWLDPTLDSLAGAEFRAFRTAPRAASLVRSMILRADIADRLQDAPTRRKWASAVVVLWSGADVFLQPVVDRMKGWSQ